MKKKMVLMITTFLVVVLGIAAFVLFSGWFVVYPANMTEMIARFDNIDMYVVCAGNGGTQVLNKVFEEEVTIDDQDCKFFSPITLSDTCRIVYSNEVNPYVNFSIKGAAKFNKIELEELQESYLFECE